MSDGKPVIGVTPLWDEEKQSIWMLPGYTDGIQFAGGVPVILPLTDDEEVLGQLAESLDGLLITGGQDVNPALYGAERSPKTEETSTLLDRMEQILLEKFLELDKPVLGICRGIQFLNVYFGGTLYQDIKEELKQEHHQDHPYDHFWHLVDITPGSPLSDILGKKDIEVNSIHHQAIHDVAPDLKVMATTEQGLVEGLYLPGKKYLLGIQWHPEYMYKTDENSQKIFASLVEASEQKN